VNIKKGQFVSPADIGCGRQMPATRETISSRNRTRSQLGYNNLVVDMRSLAIMRKFVPVVFDATHSVQLPSSPRTEITRNGGPAEFIPLLARAAVAAGVDGVSWKYTRTRCTPCLTEPTPWNRRSCGLVERVAGATECADRRACKTVNRVCPNLLTFPAI